MAMAARSLRGLFRAHTGTTQMQPAPLASSAGAARRFGTSGRRQDEAEDAKIRGLFPAAGFHEDDLGGGAKQFSLRHPDVPGVPFAGVMFMQRPGQIGMMQGTTVHPALPFVSATKLVKHVVAAAEQPPIACAALTGMCEWVRGLPESELEADFGAELAEAVAAVAHGRPRPGHSVLGQGTFRDAEPAWLALAARFADEPAAEEVRVFLAAGFSQDIRLQAMADTSPAGLAQSGGTVALLRVAPES